MSLIHGNISCCDIKLSLNGLSIQRITVYVHSTIPKCIMIFILLVIYEVLKGVCDHHIENKQEAQTQAGDTDTSRRHRHKQEGFL